MVAYDVTEAKLHTKAGTKVMDRSAWSKTVDVYNFEPPVFEGWDDLHEFYYASSVFGAYLTAIAAEQSARMAWSSIERLWSSRSIVRGESHISPTARLSTPRTVSLSF